LHAWVLALALAASPDLASEVAGAYTFVFDPESDSPTAVDIDRSGDLGPGDWLTCGDVRIVLGEPGTWRLRLEETENGERLYRTFDGGREELLGLTLGAASEPTPILAPDEIRSLRGVTLLAWNDEILAMLGRVDLEQVCISVTRKAGVGEGGALLPPLPVATRAVAIEWGTSDMRWDGGSLAELRSLRVLSAEGSDGFDVAWLRNCPELRHLDLSDTDPIHLERLADLVGLETLDLAYNAEVEDLSGLAGAPKLRWLDLEGTAVASLDPLAALPELATLDADGTPLRALGLASLPALRRLSVMGAGSSAEEVSAFAKRHPDCVVVSDVRQALNLAIAGVDRVRVRTGCPGDRRFSERVLFESRDVRAVLDRVVLAGPGDFCFCLGSPTIELLRGEEIAVALAIHHAATLSWDGWTPNRMSLTADSVAALSEWLARHGALEPRTDLLGPEDAIALFRRDELTWAPASSLEEFDFEAEGRLAAAFESAVPDPVERARLYLRMYGALEGSWNLRAGEDARVRTLLIPTIRLPDLSAVLTGELADAELQRGAVRVLFDDRRWSELDAEVRARVLDRLAPVGLESPRQVNRRRTLRELGRMDDPISQVWLRRTLAGETKPRALAEIDLQEPPVWFDSREGDREIPEAVSDRTIAAVELGSRGDATAEAAIRALAESAPEVDRLWLERALEDLSKRHR